MKTRYLTLAVAAALALTTRVSADTITLQFTGGGISQSISYNGSPQNISGNVGGGPFSWTVNSVTAGNGITAGTTVQTWCVDLFHSISASPTSYTLNNVSALPNSTSIKNLFGEGYKVGGVVADPAAFQLALWELEYDTAPGNMTSGNFQYTGSNSSVLADAQALVSKALYDTAHNVDAFSQYLSGYQMYVLDSSTKQDQVILVPPPPNKGNNPVPAPPAALARVAARSKSGVSDARGRSRPTEVQESTGTSRLPTGVPLTWANRTVEKEKRHVDAQGFTGDDGRRGRDVASPPCPGLILEHGIRIV